MNQVLSLGKYPHVCLVDLNNITHINMNKKEIDNNEFTLEMNLYCKNTTNNITFTADFSSLKDVDAYIDNIERAFINSKIKNCFYRIIDINNDQLCIDVNSIKCVGVSKSKNSENKMLTIDVEGMKNTIYIEVNKKEYNEFREFFGKFIDNNSGLLEW